MSDSIRARRLLEASALGSVNLFMELKKIKGSDKSGGSLPDIVAGATGETAIVEEFRQVYQSLYNSCNTSEAMEELKNLVENSIAADSALEADLVTGDVVKAAAGRLKPGKGDVSGSYTSDAIRACPDIFFQCLAGVFRSWIIHGTVTLSFLACAFLPLFKGGLKDPSMTDSYRAVAGASVILKLFDYVILDIWGDLLGSDSLQFGYKQDTSTTQCSWLVMEVAGHYLRQGTPCMIGLLDCSKAFDMCSFEIIFKKLMDRKLPAIIVRCLAYVYQEQTAWVKWGGANSSPFGVLNGTRQGSVLSPCIFSVYMDELLQELRQLGVGCHVGGIFMGATIYADDVLLLAPCRTALQLMLKVCEDFAKKNNLLYSTDPNPTKSKSKCLYMCGKKTARYPAELTLNGQSLPWVSSAAHLGHELSQLASMEHDAKVKRGIFIDKSTDIRQMFSFAEPFQILQAINTYCAHFYGGMLWDLFGEAAGQVFRAWNTAVKLVWEVPRSTHTYLVDHLLGLGLPSARHKLSCQYVGFFQNLGQSASREVRLLKEIVARDAQSVTGRNILNIKAEYDLDPWSWSLQRFKLKDVRKPVPVADEWRIGLLRKLLAQRREMETCGEDPLEISNLIDSLCSS